MCVCVRVYMYILIGMCTPENTSAVRLVNVARRYRSDYNNTSNRVRILDKIHLAEEKNRIYIYIYSLWRL